MKPILAALLLATLAACGSDPTPERTVQPAEAVTEGVENPGAMTEGSGLIRPYF